MPLFGKESIVPGEPAESLLYLTLDINAPCGQQMPAAGQLSQKGEGSGEGVDRDRGRGRSEAGTGEVDPSSYQYEVPNCPIGHSVPTDLSVQTHLPC